MHTYFNSLKYVNMRIHVAKEANKNTELSKSQYLHTTLTPYVCLVG